jgi:PST family polysaccharide transporter
VSQDTAVAEPSLRSQVARGAAWSGLSTIVLRLGSLVVGIVLARLLTPEQFGVYAIALTAQSILMAAADLGLSADLVRSKEPERVAPTIATLGLVTGAVTTALTFATSGLLAELLGSADAASSIAMLSFTLLLAGVSIVPYGYLLRRFQQRELLFIGVIDFTVSTIVTLVLAFAGVGPLSLAIGRVAAQAASSAAQFLFARVRPRYGIDRTVVRGVLAFGVPLASANLLGLLLLNIDNVVIARVGGATALGFYVLAFNISSWPMSALSQMVRSVALPYFSRAGDTRAAIARFSAIGWAAALPAGAVLAALSAPLIEVLYGERWLPAAPVLAALGFYGGTRVLVDIFNGCLYAQGRSRPVLWIQVLSLIALTAGMVVATPLFGIVGAAWVHVAVSVVLILPAYAVALAGSGIRAGDLLRLMWRPTAATVPAAAVALAAAALIPSPLVALLAGGTAAVGVYALLMWSWVRVHVAGLAVRG